jgi:hypothetical protein
MSDIMGVLLNGVAQLEYDRSRPLPDHQAVYLEKMDLKMDEGIQLGDDFIEHPDVNDRAQFIAANLLHAIKNDDEAMAAAHCSYLANKLPELKQIRFEEQNGEVSIELVFDEPYQKQVSVQLIH